jgi:hypothetical protein
VERLLAKRPEYNFDQQVLYGNAEKFIEILATPNVKVVYDSDGIKANSPKITVGKFNLLREDFNFRPHQITCWDQLTQWALSEGLDADLIATAEDVWYDPDILKLAEPYLYSRPMVKKSMKLSGQENNFVLTSRRPGLSDVTYKWYARHFQFLNENILIRNDEDNLSGVEFKKREIEKLVQLARRQETYVILVEDTGKNIKEVGEFILSRGYDNYCAIHMPIGLIKPEYFAENLLILKRYPFEEQGIYPLFDLMRKSLEYKENNYNVAQY